MSNVTRILSQIESGGPSAADQLFPLVHEELRKLAAAKLAHEKPRQTLQATALVHEASLRLVDVEQAQQWGRSKPTGRAIPRYSLCSSRTLHLNRVGFLLKCGPGERLEAVWRTANVADNRELLNPRNFLTDGGPAYGVIRPSDE